MKTAVAGSSSAPVYFDPNIRTDEYDIDHFEIDGAVVANNPSYYAFYMAKIMNDKENIKLLSIGTGESEPKEKIDYDSRSKKYASILDDMMYRSMIIADNYLETEFKIQGKAKDYLRVNIETGLSFDDTGEENLNGLIKNGEDLWTQDKENIKSMLRDIIDCRFGDQCA